MNIMLGKIKPSSGEILYHKKNIKKNNSKIKNDIVICSRYNNIFEGLTVEQNIIFMTKLFKCKVNVDQVLENMNLIKYKNEITAKLSHGQKRILSLGMMFLRKQKCIFIDEPTKGLDIGQKKIIWNYILRCRKEKTIIIFTSDIEEAEVLTDRKLILLKGHMCCLGTNEYIKSQLVNHYYLNIKSSSVEMVNDIIKSVIPNATLVKTNNKKKVLDINIGHVWKLPSSSISNYSSLLKTLNKRIKNEGIIKEFSITIPTLKEIYHRLKDEYETNLLELDSRDIKNEKAIAKAIPHPLLLIFPYDLRPLKILTKNRILNAMKNRKYIFWSVLIPISLVVYAFDTYTINQKRAIIKLEPLNIGSEYLYNDNRFIWNYDFNSNITSRNYKILKYVKNKANKDVLVYDKSVQYKALVEINELSVNNMLDGSIYVSNVIGYRLSRNHYRFDLIYNATLLHSLPSTINAISNSILYSKGIKQRIYTISKPFDLNSTAVMRENSYDISLIFGFVMMFASLYFLYYAMVEKTEGVYTIYRSYGINEKIYFITAMTGDFILSTLLNITILVMGIRFHNPVFEDKSSISIFFNIMTMGSLVLNMIQRVVVNFFKSKKILIFSVVIYHLMFIMVAFTFIFEIYNLDKNILYMPEYLIVIEVILLLLNPLYAVVGILFSLYLISNYSTDKFYSKLVGWSGNVFSRSELGISILFTILTSYMVCLMFLFNIFYHSTVYKYSKKGMVKRSKRIIEESCEEIKNEHKYVTDNCKDLVIGAIDLYKEYPYYSLSLNRDFSYNKKKIKKYQYKEPHSSVYADMTFSITCIDAVTFGVKQNEIFGIIGPPHSGKSCILNIVGIKETYDTGSLYINGINKANSNMEDIVISYCMQKPTLMKELTVKEQLALVLDIIGYSNQGLNNYSKELLKFYDLTEFTNVKIKDLSYDIRKILNLVVMTANAQQIVIMDEPTQGIQTLARKRFVWDRIKQCSRFYKSSILLATSSLDEAAYLCDRIGILCKGRLVYIGTLGELKRKYENHYYLTVETDGSTSFHNILIKNNLETLLDIKFELKIHTPTYYKYTCIINTNLDKLLKALEDYKSENIITCYTLSQKTINDIYSDLTCY
ncbi:P-loop containing nucleoside triphosphate hydrolase protein [Anaeromyces robustus]|uniref:p-loop containing nucleoside triphosphate hydrolase protein n=1 Tax=Anaeromyces robustus TaxID=1754192 RepID=A0A1Y1XR48_9FUNG|nr:P-loop containing nucleoside triphosphate hydrolase protein [Anaeromyces robustus]|eukprot:ORX88125.1 P-loop containing nucleoside triphosphate hydrolase protein [Anaeromyces robustus]